MNGMSKWAELIKSVGFPIVVSIFLGWFLLFKMLPVLESIATSLSDAKFVMIQHERTSQQIEDLLRRYVIDYAPRRGDDRPRSR